MKLKKIKRKKQFMLHTLEKCISRIKFKIITVYMSN